jgi:acetyl-CoA C-acetyltransferase
MNLRKVVIAAATRTPVGSFNGSLSSLIADQLGTPVIKKLLEQSGVAPAEVSEVILGQVLTAGSGQNTARQSALFAGLPFEVPAMTINKVCGSGLRAVQLGAQAIAVGEAEIVIAGGQESMSQAPHLLPRSRDGMRMGHWKMIDSMVHDGLWDIFDDYHMGVTAENVAAKYGISREDQDAFAAASQNKAEAAQKANRFAEEICPVAVPQRKGDPVIVDKDEGPRYGVTVETLAKLPTVFKKDGTVTPGNSSTINDGAAAVLLCTEEKARSLGLQPLATIAAGATAGVDTALMGTGPIPATRRCLEKAGWSIDELDLIEANEAFAAQAVCVNRELGWDTSKVNVNGGSIAIGHPIGASGCRVLVTLLHEMIKRDAKKGLTTLCIGGGMGIALAVER